MKKSDLEKYNWEHIQAIYDSGLSLRETAAVLNLSNRTLYNGSYFKFLKTRSKAEAAKLRIKKIPPPPLSEETKKKISASRKKFLAENPDKVPYRLNHSSKESYPEKTLRLALENARDKITETWIQEYQNGIYSYDFAFPELKIDVEVDGSTHLSEKVKKIDEARDSFSINEGWIVLRFSSEQVRTNVDFVIDKIIETIYHRKNDKNFNVTQVYCYDPIAFSNKKRKPKREKSKKEKHKHGRKNNVCTFCGSPTSGKNCLIHRHQYVRKFFLTKEEFECLLEKHNFILLRVAKELHISDNALRKWCKKFGIEIKNKRPR